MAIHDGIAGRTLKKAGMKRHSAFTLVEFLVCFLIAAFTISSIIAGYVLSARKTEWSTASSAAQRLAMRRMEQARAAHWDLYSNPPTNELSQLAGTTNLPLQLPVTATPTNVTVQTTVSTVSQVPPLQMIRVDCIWSCLGRGPFTNTVISYRAPDS